MTDTVATGNIPKLCAEIPEKLVVPPGPKLEEDAHRFSGGRQEAVSSEMPKNAFDPDQVQPGCSSDMQEAFEKNSKEFLSLQDEQIQM